MEDNQLSEFIALKSKLYSILYGDSKNKTTAKGISKAFIKKFINHEYYRNVLLNNNVYSSLMYRIQSKDHKINTIKQSKMVFTQFDDKKYICNDGINCLPYGHKQIKDIVRYLFNNILYYIILILYNFILYNFIFYNFILCYLIDL